MWILLDDVIRIFFFSSSKTAEHIFDFYLDIIFSHGHELDTCVYITKANPTINHFDNLHVIEAVQVPITTAFNFKIKYSEIQRKRSYQFKHQTFYSENAEQYSAQLRCAFAHEGSVSFQDLLLQVLLFTLCALRNSGSALALTQTTVMS